MRRLTPRVLLVGMGLWGCVSCEPSGAPSGASSSALRSDDSSTRSRVVMPPGAQEEDAAGASFETLLTSAKAADAARRGGEALRLYRAALTAAPASLPDSERETLAERVRSLAFTLGVDAEDRVSPGAPVPPHAAASASGAPPAHATAAATAGAASAATAESAVQARKAFQTRFDQALALEKSGRHADALQGYLALRTPELLTLDAPLYWQVFQKIEDLAPKEEVKAGRAPSIKVTYHGPSTPTPEGDEPEMPGEVPSRTVNETRFKEPEALARLARAREQYLNGMSAVRLGSPEQARVAFQQVLSLVEEKQDPELYRAARQNLQDLAQGGK